MNRLISATVNGANTTYNLDIMGNRISVIDSSGTQNYTTVDHNILTNVGTTTYTYDSLGNLVTKTGGFEYKYDEENRLRKILQNGVAIASYWYDAKGNRVRTSEGDNIVYYTYNGLNVIQEDNSTSGVKTDYIFAGATRIAEKTGSVVKYYHGDHLGSTRVVTDANGVKVAEYKYAPYGKTIAYTGPFATDYKFTGKPEDSTGLYYFGARYYDPELGRFITQDPARDGLNWYEYCYNNPLKFVDPDGHWKQDATRLLNQYHDAIIRTAILHNVPPVLLAAVVYNENSKRTFISEIKDTMAIIGTRLSGHDASIGMCQVQLSNAMLLDLGLKPDEFAKLSREEREEIKKDTVKTLQVQSDYYIGKLEDPLMNLDYAARYLEFLGDARDYNGNYALWLSDYNRGLSDYETTLPYGDTYYWIVDNYDFDNYSASIGGGSMHFIVP